VIIDLQRYWGEEEIYWPAELCSKIVDGMQQNGSVILRSKEGRCPEVSGLYNLLDQLCRYWNWEPAKITLESNNPLASHSKYNLVVCDYGTSFAGMVINQMSRIEHRPWNQEKVYGMFLGRANVTRIRGAHNHHNFEYQNLGLSSFHHDLKWHIDKQVLNEYLITSNQRYSEITSIPPYSDIDSLMSPPITGEKTLLDWGSVYEKIGIELVFETSEISTNLAFTEKLRRPILYKRPFFLVAGKHSIANLKDKKTYFKKWEYNFNNLVDNDLLREIKEAQSHLHFFENIISSAYDDDEGIYRVDHVFDILRELIRTEKIYSILENCQEDIEHNYNTIMKLMPLLYELDKQTQSLFDYESWKKPDYK
jgi:hypothetical protein